MKVFFREREGISMQEERKGNKPRWARPKLIAITRGDRQEGVLQICKGAAQPTAPQALNGVCWRRNPMLGCPTQCFSSGLS